MRDHDAGRQRRLRSSFHPHLAKGTDSTLEAVSIGDRHSSRDEATPSQATTSLRRTRPKRWQLRPGKSNSLIRVLRAGTGPTSTARRFAATPSVSKAKRSSFRERHASEFLLSIRKYVRQFSPAA